MPLEIPDLWSDDIKVDVLPPLTILKAQDEAIRRKTQGILHLEVTAREEQEDRGDEGFVYWTIYALDLVAIALGYHESLLEVLHRKGKLYPVTIQMPEEIEWTQYLQETISSNTIRCYSSETFIDHLRTALQSQYTNSVIASLIAQSNEVRMKNGTPPAGHS